MYDECHGDVTHRPRLPRRRASARCRCGERVAVTGGAFEPARRPGLAQRTLPTRPGVRPHRRRRPTTRPRAAIPRASRGGRRRRRRSGHRPAGRLGRRLVEIARQSLDAEEPPARRERSASTCSSTPPPTCPAAGPTAPIPRCLLDKLTCHSTLVPTFVEAARPVSVGRALRIVPDRTRRLILHRDAHHCRIPWCQRTRWLDVHHLVHWANGGRDSNRQRDN